MGLRDLLGAFGRQKSAEALRELAKREFERGNKAAGVAALLEIGEAAEPEVQFQIGECYETGTGVMLNFVTAADWFTKAAENDHLPSQTKLGDYYLFGRRIHESDDGITEDSKTGASRLRPKGVSVPQDYGKAAAWNLRAAEAGSTEAQARLGYQYASGLGIEPDYPLAKKWFSAAAEQGSTAGQFGLGMLSGGNYFGAPDFKSAAEWFEKAAAQGDIASKYYLALLLRDGLGVPEDHGRAAQLLTAAAEADHTDAMFHLGLLYRDGIGVSRDAVLAETWLRRASSRGQVPAMLELARLLIQQPAIPDYPSAAVLLREAADLGDPLAQYYLGQLYNAGLGVPKDQEVSASWFRKAADAGVVGAIESLGLMHAAGSGLEQDFKAAFSLLKKAADQGSASAAFSIGNLYNSGLGLERNPRAAIESYLHAAERGNADACLMLGVLHATGDGVDQDYAVAADWYRRAAEAGNTDGTSNLAFLYIRGLGVPRDEARGIAMLEELADSGAVSALWSLYNLYLTGLYLPKDALKARHWLERAADKGSGAAACEFARQVEQSMPDAPSVEKVVGWLVTGSEQKDASAQEALGRWLYEGKFVKRDQETAFRLMASSAELGNPSAQAWLGDVLKDGLVDVVVDRAAARTWYQRAAEQYHIGALTMLTDMVFADQATEEERARLYSLWQVLADAGEVRAQLRLAEFHLGGDGFPVSFDDAVKWLRLAAAQQHPRAQVQLATLLMKPGNSEDTFREAVDMLQRAAAKGDIDGEHSLGVCYHYGIVVPLDLEIADRLYRGAAIRGHPAAQFALANLLVENGDDKSLKEAPGWYEQAASAGIGEACYRLAGLYEAGKGVSRDVERASSLYRRAVALGFEDARRAIDRLADAVG